MAEHASEVGEQPLTLRYWTGRIDLRPVALFRIALGAFLLFDLLELGWELRAWFTDEGVLPRAAFLSQWARQARFDPLDAFGTPLLAGLYLVAALVASLCTTVGFGGRLAHAATWLLVSGFQERLPPLFDGSDTVLRLLLFWHAFTRSSDVWSLDALRARAAGAPLATTGPALPIRLLQLQIGWVYLCSVFFKAQGHTWHDGTAVHYALWLQHVFARPWTGLIADVPWLVAAFTWGTLVLESAFLFLTHAPVAHRPLKALALLAGVALHGGIFLTINVGHFSYLMPLAYLPMLEPAWAQAIVDAVARLGGLPGLASALVAEWVARPRVRAPLSVVPLQRSSDGTFARGGLLALCFVLVSWASGPKGWQQPPALERFVQYTSLWSSWDMFAPEPLNTDYQLVLEGRLEDGSAVELEGQGGTGPRGFFFTRWWKYLENVTGGGGEVLPLEWGRFLCRENNVGRSGPRLHTFTLHKDEQRIPPIGQPWPPVHRYTVWNHRCFDLPKDKVAAR